MEIGYIGGAVAGACAGVQAVFNYNRDNFKYDREMRQKTEFKTREWRNSQVSLWRDDIREIIGLTERKMDSYLMVGTLQLGMCIVLFCEGRLEPGTPPWLMHLYMMSTAGAFLYLLMSVWLAMHASIVAQCSSVRLLTQYVRLPIPSWEELQDMRTWGQTYEHLDATQMMRVPFTGHPGAQDLQSSSKEAPGKDEAPAFGAPFGSAAPSTTIGAVHDETATARAIDPWLKEAHATDRDGLYELMHMPAAYRRHIHLARRASSQYQAFDAFTRTSLSFGTHQLLGSVTYYCVGYCSIQDGAPWPAICVGAVMVAASMTLAQLDFSMTWREQVIARILIATGPLLSSILAWACTVNLPNARFLVLTTIPVASLCHGLWLVFSLKAIGVEQQDTGAMLPMRFRAVLYLDVFGWFNHGSPSTPGAEQPRGNDYTEMMPVGHSDQYKAAFDVVSPGTMQHDSDSESVQTTMSELQNDIREQVALWRSEEVVPLLNTSEAGRIQKVVRCYEKVAGEDTRNFRTGLTYEEDASGLSGPWLRLHGSTDLGTESPYLFQPSTGSVQHHEARQASTSGQTQELEALLERDDDVVSISMLEEDVKRFCEELQDEELRNRHKPKPGIVEPILKLDCTEESNVRSTVDKADEMDVRSALHEELTKDDEVHRHRHRRRRHRHECVCPPGKAALLPERIKLYGEPTDDVIVGYGDLKPGMLPWQIFRSATLIMASLWVAGACLPAVFCPDMLVKNLNVLEEGVAVREERRNHRTKAVSKGKQELPEDNHHLDLLTGIMVDVFWPSHSGFQPRALTCDPTGTHIVVADDFGLYASQLVEVTSENLSSAERQLRGSLEDGIAGDNNRGRRSRLVVEFIHQPHCATIEGHGLQDVGLSCGGDETQSMDCRALVLHDHGHRLAECPVHLKPSPLLQALPNQSVPAGAAARASAASTQKSVGPMPTWTISENWLHGTDASGVPEYVDALAVTSRCMAAANEGGRDFRPEMMAGCVIVGTSLGRIVELRSHYFDKTQLVPEKALQQFSSTVGQGSLHIFSDGVAAALHGKHATIRAFDEELGKNIGEWRLPSEEIRWMNLCGGGGHFFVLGHKLTTGEPRLYRFDMPQKLKDWQAQRSNELHLEN